MGALKCENGSANSIFIAIKNHLYEFNAFPNIKMIIKDNTAVNTGSKNGVVVKLKELFHSSGLSESPYVACELHILDLSIKHILNAEFPNHSSKPEIQYEFVDTVVKNYN